MAINTFQLGCRQYLLFLLLAEHHELMAEVNERGLMIEEIANLVLVASVMPIFSDIHEVFPGFVRNERDVFNELVIFLL